MCQTGKTSNIIKEMNKANIDILKLLRIFLAGTTREKILYSIEMDQR